jgi:hypothetical protein
LGDVFLLPTISMLTDPLLGSGTGRAVALLAWICFGCFPAVHQDHADRHPGPSTNHDPGVMAVLHGADAPGSRNWLADDL